MARASTDKCESKDELIGASKQNRSALRETQPFMFQRAIVRVRGIASGNEHNPKTFSQFVLVLAHNLSQTAPNAVASNCASDAT